MGIKIHRGTFDEYSAFADGPQRRSSVEYVKERLHEKVSRFGEYGRRALDRLNERFKDIDYDAIERKARALARRSVNAFGRDEIRPLRTIGEFQHAKNKMRRYIMASPIIRKHFKAGRCEGYGDNYIDPYPNSHTHHHIDYRRMNDGLPQKTEEGVIWTNYFDQKGYLSSIEKEDIRETVSLMEFFFQIGSSDPTSVDNKTL